MNVAHTLHGHAESSGAKSRVNVALRMLCSPVSRERAAVASAARRIDAIEHVDAAVDRSDQIADGSDAHEVARFFRGQQTRRETGGDIEIAARSPTESPPIA